MTPTERALLLRVHRKTGTLTPELAAAILAAYRLIADRLPESEIARLVTTGAFDLLVASVISDTVLDIAFRPVRTALRRSLEQSVAYFARDLPTKARTIGIQFDVLNPNVLTALQSLDDKILPTLKSDVRESIRQALRAGIEAGENPRAVARGIRDVVGLAPNQLQSVLNLRRELETGQYATAAERELLDARFNLAKLDALSQSARAARIDTIVESYRTSFEAFHAETIARTAVLDAYKRGQALAWQQAVDDGIVDGGRLMKRWIQVQRPTKREAHIPLNGEVVAFDQPYSNGQMIPGETDYNCACMSMVFQARAA